MKSERSAQDNYTQDIEAINEPWRHVIANLEQATLEYLTVDEATRANLSANFWPTHVALLAEADKQTPGIANKIITRAEEIGEEQRTAEMKAFEMQTLPKAKRRAYMRGFMSVLFLRGTTD